MNEAMRKCILSLSVSMALCAGAGAAEFFVSPGGDDAADGSFERPFATPARARDAIRALKDKGGATVWLRGGEYRMREPLTLDATDSGTAKAPVAYRAWKGETPVLTGAWTVPQSVWRIADDPRIPAAAKGKVWAADVKSQGYDAFEPDAPCGYHVARPEFRIRSLYCDGRRLTLARYPDKGFLRTGKTTVPGRAFKADAGDMARWSPANAPALEALGYWQFLWADLTVPASVDPAAGTIILNIDGFRPNAAVDASFHLCQESGYNSANLPVRLSSISAGHPFYLQNALAALDAPGEWYLDCRTGTLYVYPENGKGVPSKCRYELSLAAHSLVAVKGARHLCMEGIVFRGGRHHGVEMHGVADVKLQGCVLRDFGGHGLLLDGVRDTVVHGCVFRTFGHCAMTLDGGDRKTLTPSGAIVEACDFSDTGLAMRTYTPGIWVTGCGHRIVRSHFHDLPSSAMRVGGNEHLVASNLVERVVMESDDQGGVDMWGDPTHRGNRFIHNIWRDIGREGPFVRCGQGGIRFDDAISGNYVYGNRFVNCSRMHFGGVQIHGGRDNVVRNNVFVRCRHGVTVSPWKQNLWRKFNSGAAHETRCKAANVSGPAFRAKYPEFGSLLDTPMRNTIENNVFEGDEKAFACVGYGGALPKDTIVRGNKCMAKLPSDLSVIPGFDPLPPESAIGPGDDALLRRAREAAAGWFSASTR